MSKRKEFPRKVRKQAIERANGKCENKACGAVLKPREAEVDHILPSELGGEPVLANAQVLCKVCHKGKTANDIRRIRKSDRMRDKDSGAIKPAQSIQSAPFARSEKAARKANRVPKPELPPRQLFKVSSSAEMVEADPDNRVEMIEAQKARKQEKVPKRENAGLEIKEKIK